MNKTMIKTCCAILLIAVCLLASCSFAACNHQWVTYKVDKATCTQFGTDYLRCKLCGEEETEIHLPDLGNHSWRETSRLNPNCSREGYINYRCTRCNGTKTTKLNKNGVHDYVVYKTDAATCTTAGKEYRRCSRCGYESTRAIKALGHIRNGHNWSEPTCAKGGWDRIYCGRCGYTYSYVSLPKTENHNWVRWGSAINAGIVYQCNICWKYKTVYKYAGGQ